MTDDHPLAEADAPGAWAMVGLLMATWVMAYIDRMILLLLVPGIKASFAASDTQVAMLFGLAFSIDFVVSGLIMGRLVDGTNRRNLLCFALIGWSIGAIVCGLAHSFAVLLVGRLLIGAAEAALAPASYSLIADLFPMARRGRPITLLIATSSFGSALSNIIGGVLLQYLMKQPPIVLPVTGLLAPWQATMALASLPGFLLAPLFLLVREPARRGGGIADAGKGGAVAYIRAHPQLFGLMFAAVAFAYIVGYGLSGWYPALLMRVTGLSPAETGLSMGLITIAAAIVAGLAGGWLSDRMAKPDPGGGRLKLAAILLVGEFVVLTSLAAPHNLPVTLTGFGLFALLSTVTASCGFAILPDIVPNAVRGRIIAIYQLVGNLGGLGLGPTLVALVTDHVIGDERQLGWSMLLVALPCTAIAAALYVALIPRARALRATLESAAPIMHNA